MTTEGQEQEFTLDSILGGAVAARVQEALAKLAASIDDPNTEAKAKRELTVRAVFRPTKDRRSAEVSVEVTTKLPNLNPMVTTAFVGYSTRERRHLVREHNPDQAALFESSKSAAGAADKKPDA